MTAAACNPASWSLVMGLIVFTAPLTVASFICIVLLSVRR